MPLILPTLAAAAAFALPAPALAMIDAASVQTNLDHDWTMTAAALVMLMQMGFLMLESGFVRTKNSINVAQKNIADIGLSICAFWLIGFTLMFGESVGGWFGWSADYAMLDVGADWDFTFFVFQAMFAGTAATIVSGAVAERFAFNGYVLVTLLIAVAIYPIFGHWAWGGLLIAGNPAWLADMGFVDFAGSTVVHSIGAWSALATIIIIGARKGRFDRNGEPVTVQGHNPVVGGAGAILLFVGWIGFNGGSTTAGTSQMAHIVLNTIVAGAFGCVAGIVYGRVADGLLKPDRSINGMLGGLVAVTAGCDALSAEMAALTGVIGALVAQVANDVMLRWCKLDDVVGAIGVHGFGGVAGTLGLAFLADPANLPTGNMWSQAWVQLVGAGAAFALSFGLTGAVLLAVNLVHPLRISALAESQGLNRAEHGASLGTGNLQLVITELLRGEADLSTRIPAEPGDEAAEVTELFNLLLQNLHRESNAMTLRDEARRKTLEDAAAADAATVAEISSLIERAAEGDLSGRINLGAKVGALRAVSAGVNGLFDAMDDVVGDLRAALAKLSTGDLTARMRADYAGAYGEIARSYDMTAEKLSDAVRSISASAGDLGSTAHDLGTSAGDLESIALSQNRSAEEIADALLEAQSSLHESSGSAITAREAAQGAHALAGEAQGESAETAKRMAEVRAAMERASGMVETIDSIARQTNLLAINAAVEAMRAGDAGRSFVVVAAEVRALSNRVADSSREIASIIAACHRLVGEGSAAVEAINERLTRIGRNATEVNDVVADVAGRLAADAARVDRLNEIMGELREGAENAAALSTRSHDASEGVERSSGELAELVQRFRIDAKARDDAAA